MAVRFVIGRAGSGKTHHCLESIRSRLRQDPVEGPRLLLLVPEQAGLQMERALLRSPAAEHPATGLTAFHRAEVLSFNRLAFRVLDAAGGTDRRSLTETARAMVLRHFLSQCSGDLRYYRWGDRSGRRHGGLVERLGATMAEFMEEAVQPHDLDALVDDAEPPSAANRPDDPAQRAKLHDLRLLYEAYVTYLGEDKLDPSQYLQLARERLSRCPWLTGAELWVDGFASFSGQETLMLVALARLCSRAEITAMVDPRLDEGGGADARARAVLEPLFGKTLRSLQDLRDRFADAGIPVEPALRLDADPQPRFSRAPDLARMERRLFMAPEPGAAQARSPAAIELIELPSRRVEVEYAVSRVARWVADSATRYRYRDIALIIRDLGPYHDLLSAALTARRIPFFIDRRRPVAHHPLVELLRGILGVAVEDASQDSVRIVLHSGLLPLASRDADELENYVLANNVAGAGAWDGDDWKFPPRPDFGGRKRDRADAEYETLTRINEARRQFLVCARPWLEAATESTRLPGPGWSQKIADWFQALRVSETLENWSRAAASEGDLDQAEEHRHVWNGVRSFLDDLTFAFADVPLTVHELADVVEAGLAGLTLGLIPPTVDQVLVGAIERSRHPDVKAAIILGFNDGVFPAQPAEDSILNDDDRATLGRAGLRIRAGARDRVLDERLLVYVALTRPSERLVVTYPAADESGRALFPSPCVAGLTEACPGLCKETVPDPVRSRETWDILTRRDLNRRLVWEFRDRPPRQRDHPAVRGRWNNLYHESRTTLAVDSPGAAGVSALVAEPPVRVGGEWPERLYGKHLNTSVSGLETYAACPFQYFARYVLRLMERPSGTLEPVDIGSVHHSVLEEFIRTVSNRGLRLPDLSEAELIETLRQSCDSVGQKIAAGGIVSNARNAYMLRRSASSLARILRAQRRIAAAGAFSPKAVELPFGMDVDGSLPAIRLRTPAGRSVRLRGYIDRVDLAELGDELLGVVIDYKKSREKTLDLGRVFHGLSLQLPAYLLALGEHGRTLAGRPIRPAAALYVAMSPQYKTVDHPQQAGEHERVPGERARLRGLVRMEAVDVLDATGFAGWSEHFQVYRKQDGAVGHLARSDVADSASFDAVLERTRAKLGELADGILDGAYAVRPCRLGTFSPCGWCEMASVCRFEMGLSEVAFLESLPRAAALEALKAAGGRANPAPRPGDPRL